MASILKAYSQVKPYGAFIHHWYENMIIIFAKKYVFMKCSISITCWGTKPVEIDFSLKEVSSCLVYPRYSGPLAPKSPSVPQRLGSSGWKAKQTQVNWARETCAWKSTSKSRAWQRQGRELKLLGHAGIKEKTFQPTGVWTAKAGMNFHRNRYKYSGLGRHYFGDSSSLQMYLYMTTLLASS